MAKSATSKKSASRAKRRRTGSKDSKTRLLLVDTTEQLMIQEGYAAVTSRRVAIDAGVTAPLVHYYFPSLDDLFVAVLARRAEEQIDRQARLLAADEPLRALWKFNTDRGAARFVSEFMALSSHRPAVQKEFAAFAERFRAIELEALEAAVDDGRIDLGGMSPAGVLVLLATAARGLVSEQAVGMHTGHVEVHALVEELLVRAERRGAQ